MIFLSLFACQTGFTSYHPDLVEINWGVGEDEVVDEADVVQQPETTVEEEEVYIDEDEDGYSVEEGDCDDTNPDLTPDAIDECDGIDNNCDGQIDEDLSIDQNEPNDESGTDLGDYFTEDSIVTSGFIGEEEDLDRFHFYLSDPIGGWFQIDVNLQTTSLSADYVVEFWILEDINGNEPRMVQLIDDSGVGAGESYTYSGIPFSDDAGLYGVVVYSNGGSGCDTEYDLSISFTN